MDDLYRLYCGDCRDIVPTLPPHSVDAIITDIPYGTTACKWDSIIPFDDLWRIVKHVLKPRGVFVTTASQPFTSALVMSNVEWFKYCWVWNKELASGALNSDVMPLKTHEDICVFCNGRTTYNRQMRKGKPRANKPSPIPNGDIRQDKRTIVRGYKNNDGLYNPVSILTIGNTKRNGNAPTQKPVALYEYLVRTYTNKGETVLDITMGSGTTGVACVNTGRDFIGIELDPEYYAIAEKRISEACAQLRMPL